MSHLTIDQSICTGCGRCVRDCPMGIPQLDENAKAFSDEGNAEVCIYCGHCVAVCPVKAIKLTPDREPANKEEMDDYGIVPLALAPEECFPTELDNIPEAKQVESLIRSRRMTRSFQNKLVPHDVVNHIVDDVLAYTPTGHNNRGYFATIVEGREKLERLTELSLAYFEKGLGTGCYHSFDEKVFSRMIAAWKEGTDRVFRTAHQAIIIHCKSSVVPADPAVKVMLTYFEMLCNSMGLGTVWAGYFMVAANDPEIKSYLGIPEDHSIYGAMMFGYPEFTYERIPKRPEITVNYL